MPTVVVEAGWSEFFPRLRNDMKLWIQGGAGGVKMVLLFKWSQLKDRRVKAAVEVYDVNPAGNENLMQTEVAINLSNII